MSLTVLTTWLKHTVYVLFHALSSDVTVYVTPPFVKCCTESLDGEFYAPSVSEKMGAKALMSAFFFTLKVITLSADIKFMSVSELLKNISPGLSTCT